MLFGDALAGAAEEVGDGVFKVAYPFANFDA